MKIQLLLFLLLAFSGFAQENYIEFQLSFEYSEQQFQFSPGDTTRVQILVINNGPCPYQLFPMSCDEGRKSIGFEIITSDSIYCINRQERLSIRNVVGLDELAPNDTLIWEVDIIDSAILDDPYGRGYVGMPMALDTKAYIRLKYNLAFEDAQTLNISRLKYRKEDYLDYLDEDIESSIFYAETDIKTPAETVAPTKKSVYTIDEGLLIGTFYSPWIELVYR